MLPILRAGSKRRRILSSKAGVAGVYTGLGGRLNMGFDKSLGSERPTSKVDFLSFLAALAALHGWIGLDWIF